MTARRLVRTDADLVEAYRARIRELQITHETVDAIAGWAPGWCSKIMCGMKKPGQRTRDIMNEVLGIAQVIVEDSETAARMRKRWTKRERPIRASTRASIEAQPPEAPLPPHQARMRLFANRGGNMRAHKLGKRRRREIARLAIRARWRKAKRKSQISDRKAETVTIVSSPQRPEPERKLA